MATALSRDTGDAMVQRQCHSGGDQKAQQERVVLWSSPSCEGGGQEPRLAKAHDKCNEGAAMMRNAQEPSVLCTN